MCGIVGYIGKSDALPFLLAGLQKLEYRGYDSAGVSLLVGGALFRFRAEGYVAHLVHVLHDAKPASASIGIGHTRWATHGAPSEKNAHPHADCSGAFHVVHNGIIENFDEIKQYLQGEVHVFSSDTDTEVLAHLVEHFYLKCSSVEVAFRSALALVRGSYAVVLVSTHTPEVLYCARLASPLLIGIAPDALFIASDRAPLIGVADAVLELADGQMARLAEAGALTLTTLKGESISAVFEPLTKVTVAASKDGHEYFMGKEIAEASQVVRAALLNRLGEGALNGIGIELGSVATAFAEAKVIRIVACGTSYHAALLGKRFFESVARISAEVEIASEFRYREYIPIAGEVVLAISQSGETADTLAAIKKAHEYGVPTLGIVNVTGSSIARAVDAVLYCHAGPEISVASTKACISQAVVCALLALQHAPSSSRATLLDELRALPLKLDQLLSDTHAIQNLALRIAAKEHVFFIGRGGESAVSLEAALKVKEIAYIYAEGYPAGELKHGTLALIDSSTVTVALVSSDAILAEKIASNCAEVEARGGTVIAIVPEGIATHVKQTISIPRVHHLIQPILHTTAMHVLAYHLGIARKVNIDKPRNLAKAVTVE